MHSRPGVLAMHVHCEVMFKVKRRAVCGLDQDLFVCLEMVEQSELMITLFPNVLPA